MLRQWQKQDVTATWGKLVDAVDIVSNTPVSTGGMLTQTY